MRNPFKKILNFFAAPADPPAEVPPGIPRTPNLKTHVAYPEIQIAEDFSWTARMINRYGETVDEMFGYADTHDMAKFRAKEFVNSVAQKYKKVSR